MPKVEKSNQTATKSKKTTSKKPVETAPEKSDKTAEKKSHGGAIVGALIIVAIALLSTISKLSADAQYQADHRIITEDSDEYSWVGEMVITKRTFEPICSSRAAELDYDTEEYNVCRRVGYSVTEPETSTVEKTESTDFETEYQDDPELEEGKTETTQEGSAGEKLVAYEICKFKDRTLSEKRLSETVTKEPVKRIVRRGTKKVEEEAPVATTTPSNSQSPSTSSPTTNTPAPTSTTNNKPTSSTTNNTSKPTATTPTTNTSKPTTNTTKPTTTTPTTTQPTTTAKPTTTTTTKPTTTQPSTSSSEKLPLKAQCKDGTFAYKKDVNANDYRGLCSGHGGIKTKLGRVK